MTVRAGSQAPLIFIRPIGFNAAESMAIVAQLAGLNSESVRWRLPPQGVPPDAYIAHIRCLMHTPQMDAPITQTATALAIGKPADEFYPLDSGTFNKRFVESESAALPQVASIIQPDMLSTFSGTTHALAGLHLDPAHLTMQPEPYYRGLPLCLLGDESDTESTWSDINEQTRGQLYAALNETAPQLDHLRIAYTLGEIALQHRDTWDTQQLLVQDGADTIAVIHTKHWQVHLSPQANAAATERASVKQVGVHPLVEPVGHELLPLESVLWVYAQRCNEAALLKLTSPALLNAKLVLRRPPLLSNAQMGRHSTTILRRIDMQAISANELQIMLRMERPALLRAIISLAITRVIAPESAPFAGSPWLNRAQAWLTKALGLGERQK
jgi:hypothetical protein